MNKFARGALVQGAHVLIGVDLATPGADKTVYARRIEDRFELLDANMVNFAQANKHKSWARRWLRKHWMRCPR